jgi:hypothetical protein
MARDRQLPSFLAPIDPRLAAQRLGFVWLGVGVVILAVLYATGRRPHLAALTETGDEPMEERR